MGNDIAALEVAGLLFACVPKGDLDRVAADGLDLGAVELHPTLKQAKAFRQKGERVVVARGGTARNGRIAPKALANLNPYRKPKKIRAGGGLVLRPGEASEENPAGEPEALLIYRRGAWDIPKGKRDKGETMKQTALREVREEVGIAPEHPLDLLGRAGTTVHGYPDGKRFAVKRTWWYFMHTPAREFTPERREGIKRVAWVPWSEAQRRLDYDSLRRLLDRLGVEAAVAALGVTEG